MQTYEIRKQRVLRGLV